MKNRLLKKIDKYSVVSFDIFDTLIERDTEVPTDIFKRVAEVCLEGTEARSDFWKNRIWAENESRAQRVDGEVTLDEIYKVLLTKYDEISIEVFKRTEILEELKACKIKSSMQSVYKYAVNNAKKVYLISDMYLPKEVLEQLLKKCSIDGYEKIYVSNEYRANKISGKLFQIVCEENRLQTEEWLHVGDSFRADYLGAKSVKITSILIGRKNVIKRKMLTFFRR